MLLSNSLRSGPVIGTEPIFSNAKRMLSFRPLMSRISFSRSGHFAMASTLHSKIMNV